MSSLALLALAGGCVAGPDYAPPADVAPLAYSRPSGPTSVDLGSWWSGQGDPVLNDLMDQALRENLDLQQAASRVQQAREQERIVRGGGGPQVNANAQAARTQLSENSVAGLLSDLGSGGGPGTGLGAPGAAFSTFQVGFDSSWELDLFGGRRRANEAGQARSEAAKWSRRDAQVVLTAEVARRYQLYRADQRRRVLLDEMIADQEERIRLTSARTDAGLVNDADVLEQAQDLERLLAQRDDLNADHAAHLHALGLLTGALPDRLTADLGAPSAEIADVAVSAGLPAELLQRRPDVRAAERKLAAASADIGVAVADLYPRISLTGTLQLVSRSLSTLLEADSLQASGAGGLSLPLLDRGVRRSTVKLREAQAQEAALAYRQSVRVAVRDVEDGLARLEADRLRTARLSAATASAEAAGRIAETRYRHGLTSMAEVISARRTALAARDQQVQAQTAVLIDIAALSKALGGGWSDPSHSLNEDSVLGQTR